MVAACQFPVNYGSPAAIRELCETLSENGHRIHVITYPDGQDLSVGKSILHRVGRARASADLRVGPSWQKPWLDLLMLFKVCAVVRREKADLIHAHNYEGGLIGVAAKFLTGRPLIYNSVNLMSDELHTYNVMPRFLAKLVAGVLDWFVPIFPDHLIAVTRELYDWHAQHGTPRARLTLVPCGIKPEMFANPQPEPLRARFAIGARPVVMYTGINNAFQRVDHLVRAFRLVLDQIPDALLMIVSPIENEPNRPVNEALGRELGVDGSIIWVGGQQLHELKDYLALADVCVVPRCECPGHPIKLLNYMMAEKPVVCFAGAAKGVSHLREAWIVPNHDTDGLAQGIVTLLRDKELARRLAAQGRETTAREFDWRILAKTIETIYAGLVPGPARE